MKIKHEPGQFVQVSIPGFGEAPISICSDSEEFIKLNIREVGNVTRSLSKLKKDDTIFIRGPYGKAYPMQLLKGNNIIIIGGGCGVAPLKGVIDYIENHRQDYKDIYLILGYKSENDIIFKKDVDKWCKKYHVELTLDKKADGHVCYHAKQGLVTDALKNLNITNENKVVFICGPPVMVKPVIDTLKEKGFNDDQIFISAERLMYCAMGVCCHCMIHGKFTCVDGPVFRYDKIKDYKND
jgi:anaerobic sulfite reductase subunit B